MRVTAKVKEATERSIRSSARKLFIRKGLEATSTRDIAGAAKVAVGTLFNYFSSKEALAVAIAADAFADGREKGMERLSRGGAATPVEDLFTLIAADIRALEGIREFVGEVLETAMSPFSAGDVVEEAAEIRTQRLQDAAGVLAKHGLDRVATGAVMHLYWSVYLGVLSFWSSDASPKQEDTWALLDRGVRMFISGLKAVGDGPRPAFNTEVSP